MKIKVPITAVEANLNDREMVFVNLITQFLHEGDIKANEVKIDTEFYFYAEDIRKITGRQCGDIHGNSFEKLREVLTFKHATNDKYAITLKEPRMNRRGIHGGSLKLVEHTLTNERAIHLYFYLIGVTSVKGIVREFKNLNQMPKNSRINHSRLVKVRVQ